MSVPQFPQSYAHKQYLATTSIAVVGAAGTIVRGPTITSILVGEALAARVLLHPSTSTVDFIGIWQVLDDNGSSWITFVPYGPFALATYLGGAGATANSWATAAGGAVTLYVECPRAIVAGNRSAAFAVYVTGAGTAVGGTTDYFNCEYDFRSPLNVYGP